MYWNTILTVRIVLVLVIFSKYNNNRSIPNKNVEIILRRPKIWMILESISHNKIYCFQSKHTKYPSFDWWVNLFKSWTNFLSYPKKYRFNLHIQISVILVGIVLVLELYWNCCFGCVYCIGIGPKRLVLFNWAKHFSFVKNKIKNKKS